MSNVSTNASTYEGLIHIMIGDVSGVVYTTQLTYDIYTNELIYASLVGYKTTIDKVADKIVKSRETVGIRAKGIYCSKGRGVQYTMDTRKDENSDLVHANIYIKDYHKINTTGEEFTIYMYAYEDDENRVNRIKDLLYDKLYKYSSVPMIEDWKDYIYDELVKSSALRTTRTILMNGTREVGVLKYVGNYEQLKTIIKTGLERKEINIEGSNEPSTVLEDISGLDSYLSMFGSLLADKIQNKFKPKFVPGVDKYDNYTHNVDAYMHYNGRDLFEAQLAVIQSSVNNLNKNKYGIIVGEMGSGKTLQSAGACYVHNANKFKGFNALIMCPTHILQKWKYETEKYIPNAKAYIVHNLDELLELEDKLRDRNRVENMYVIMSKEIAKLGFDKRPAAIWSKSKNCYVCPECGQPLYKLESNRYSRGHKVRVRLKELDFLKQYSHNTTCPNEVRYWDKKSRSYRTKTCDAKLWTALNRDDNTHGWIKLGETGWIRKEHIIPEMEKLTRKGQLDKKETALFNRLFDQYEYYQEHNDFNVTYKGPKKYPVAKYIYERMNQVFDYFIADEAHQLMSTSLQGHAGHLLMRASKKVMLLTGTLLNGYASNIFYMLFRVCPHVMVQEGFFYEEVMDFARMFGVTSKESTYESSRNSRYKDKVGTSREKELPGISPLIFTKFLLNMTAFIKLTDMKEGLPNYTEIPVGIDMDSETARGYDDIKSFFSDRIGTRKGQTMKVMSSTIKLMTQYPDAPHCAREVKNPDTDTVEYSSVVLPKTVRNKDQKLIEIIKNKLARGEKVMVFYNTINTTDLGDHIRSYLLAEDINAFELKASVKAEKRMEHIDKELNKGAQVMITNPALVETGVDLLDFTTIIFYQVGYNLSTMRQASRRSWRLSQSKDIEVYFMYYKNTIQEQALSLMATKLQASQAIESDLSEEGLKAMSDNDDILTKIATNVVNDIKQVVNLQAFKSSEYVKEKANKVKEHKKTLKQIELNMNEDGKMVVFNHSKSIYNNNSHKYMDASIVSNLKNPMSLFIS